MDGHGPKHYGIWHSIAAAVVDDEIKKNKSNRKRMDRMNDSNENL